MDKQKAHCPFPDHAIEPNWKEELAELRSRPENDPYQIAVAKMFELLGGMADEELKSILSVAIWKQAIEPLVKVLSPTDAVDKMVQSIEKALSERYSLTISFYDCRAKIKEAIKLFNPSGAAPQADTVLREIEKLGISADERLSIHVRNHQLREALQAYVNAQGRMLDRWADGDDAVKRDLRKVLHDCEEKGRAALETEPAQQVFTREQTIEIAKEAMYRVKCEEWSKFTDLIHYMDKTYPYTIK